MTRLQTKGVRVVWFSNDSDPFDLLGSRCCYLQPFPGLHEIPRVDDVPLIVSVAV
jgi:hypothetical protein